MVASFAPGCGGDRRGEAAIEQAFLESGVPIEGFDDRQPAIEQQLEALGFRRLGTVITRADPDAGIYVDDDAWLNRLLPAQACQAFTDGRGTLARPSAWVDGPMLELRTRTADGTLVVTARQPARSPHTQLDRELDRRMRHDPNPLARLAWWLAPRVPRWHLQPWVGSGLDVELVALDVATDVAPLVARHRARVGPDAHPVAGATDVLALTRASLSRAHAVSVRTTDIARRLAMAARVVLSAAAAAAAMLTLVALGTWTWGMLAVIALVFGGLVVVAQSWMTALLWVLSVRAAQVWVRRIAPLKPVTSGRRDHIADNPFAP